MRLPGTMNLPNAKKRERGQEPRLAELISENDERVELADFDILVQNDVQPTCNIGGDCVESDIPAKFWELLESDQRLRELQTRVPPALWLRSAEH